MELLFQPETWIALTTLTALEIVLGIDNIIFISILASRLPAGQRSKGRILGLGLAMVTRILLLLSIAWVMGLKTGLFTVLNHEISGRDIILLCGGLFLLAKSTHEIHHSLEDNGHEEKKARLQTLQPYFFRSPSSILFSPLIQSSPLLAWQKMSLL